MEKEIKPAEWQEFCERFSRHHGGKIVRIDVMEGPLCGAATSPCDLPREVVHDTPLRILAAVPNPHGTSLFVETGDGGRTTRVLVEQPTCVRIMQTDAGNDAGLCIDAAEGQTTRLTFRAVSPAERTDDLAETERDPH